LTQIPQVGRWAPRTRSRSISSAAI
jgi:hypothetical protein